VSLEAMQKQETCEHPTPKGILDAARNTFMCGFVDLDPASSKAMNQFVKAARYFTKEDDAINRDWTSINVFLNPPGSQTPKGEPRGASALEWLDKLVLCYQVGTFLEAIYIGYNGPETLSKRPGACRIASGIIHSSREHACTDPENGMTSNGRIKFLGDRPFFPSVILYFGADSTWFFKYFSKFGTRIIVP
jgi:DNA N-6-adenine-methyltransferase (Dam)